MGQIHTLSSDPNISRPQSYTIDLYREIEETGGRSAGLHIAGGVYLASGRSGRACRSATMRPSDPGGRLLEPRRTEIKFQMLHMILNLRAAAVRDLVQDACVGADVP